MWEKGRKFIRTTMENVTPWLLAPTLALGVALDFWSHPHGHTALNLPYLKLLADLPKIAPKADLTRRELLSNIPQVGPYLAEHIGNFGYSSALMIPLSALGFLIKEYGHSRNNKVIEALGDILPLAGFLGIAALNLVTERTTQDNAQLLGDVFFGVAGAALAHATTCGTLERIATQRELARVNLSVVS